MNITSPTFMNARSSLKGVKPRNFIFWSLLSYTSHLVSSSAAVCWLTNFDTMFFLNSWFELQTLFWLKLMRCNKVKQLSPQYDSHYQMEEKRRKRLYYNWFIRIGWGCWISCTQQIIHSGMHARTCMNTSMNTLVRMCKHVLCAQTWTATH